MGTPSKTLRAWGSTASLRLLAEEHVAHGALIKIKSQFIRVSVIAPAAWQYSLQSAAPHREPVLVSRLPFWGSGFFGYLSLEVWLARQATNAAAACSRSSALLNLRRGCFGGGTETDVAPLMSSTPRRRIRLRCFIRDQFVRPDITHFLATRALHSKAAGENSGKAGGFALAPRTRSMRKGNIVGAVEPVQRGEKPGPTRQSYTRASRLGTNWVIIICRETPPVKPTTPHG
jgi:hypothetical protein